MAQSEKASPRLDALRAMREATYEKATASKREMERASVALAKRKLEDLAEVASDLAVAAANRRKAKKVAKNSRRGEPQ